MLIADRVGYFVADRVGYFVADNDSSNDVAVAAICRELNLANLARRRVRCLSYIINLSAKDYCLVRRKKDSISRFRSSMRWQCLMPNPTRRVASGEVIRPTSRLPQGNYLKATTSILDQSPPSPALLPDYCTLLPSTSHGSRNGNNYPRWPPGPTCGSWSRGPNPILPIGGYTEQSLEHLPLILSGNRCQTH